MCPRVRPRLLKCEIVSSSVLAFRKAASLAGCQQPEDTAVLMLHLSTRGENEKACGIQTTQCIFLDFTLYIAESLNQISRARHTVVGRLACWDEPVRACMCFTESEENEWRVKEITLQFLQAVCRNQASAGQGAPKGLFSISFSLPHCKPCSPSPFLLTKTHACSTHSHAHTVIHTQQYLARGVISFCPIKTLLQLTFHIPDN